MRRWLLGTVLILALAVPTLAEDPPKQGQGVDLPITLDAENRPAAEVIETIASAAKLNVITAPGIAEERITVSFKAVPAGAALKRVAEAAGAALVEEVHGIFRMIRKKHLRANHDYYRFQSLPRPNGTAMPAAIEALRQVLPEGAKLVYVPREHAVILSSRADHTSSLIRLIKALDRLPPRPLAGEGGTSARVDAPLPHSVRRPVAPTAQASRRAHYEQMLRDCRTETAAKYFVDRLVEQRANTIFVR